MTNQTQQAPTKKAKGSIIDNSSHNNTFKPHGNQRCRWKEGKSLG